MAGSRRVRTLLCAVGTVASAIALASSPSSAAPQPTAHAPAPHHPRPTPPARRGITLVPTTAPLPSDQPEYYPVGQHGPVSGESLRSPSIVYQNTGGGYYIATDPAPGGNPPFNGLLDGVAFTTPGTWANGSSLTQIQTVFRKHVTTPESFLVIVRLFNTIDTNVPDPGNINLAPLTNSVGGTTVAFGPVTSNGGIGNYLITLNTTGDWPGAVFTDNNLGIDFKYVLATATPADYLNPAFLHTRVTGNFFSTGLPLVGGSYPIDPALWVDQDDPGGSPPLLRNGDYQAGEIVRLVNGTATARPYLKVTADVACQTFPSNDACASAAVITPPPSGGTVIVPDASASPPSPAAPAPPPAPPSMPRPALSTAPAFPQTPPASGSSTSARAGASPSTPARAPTPPSTPSSASSPVPVLAA